MIPALTLARDARLIQLQPEPESIPTPATTPSSEEAVQPKKPVVSPWTRQRLDKPQPAVKVDYASKVGRAMEPETTAWGTPVISSTSASTSTSTSVSSGAASLSDVLADEGAWSTVSIRTRPREYKDDDDDDDQYASYDGDQDDNGKEEDGQDRWAVWGEGKTKESSRGLKTNATKSISTTKTTAKTTRATVTSYSSRVGIALPSQLEPKRTNAWGTCAPVAAVPLTQLLREEKEAKMKSMTKQQEVDRVVLEEPTSVQHSATKEKKADLSTSPSTSTSPKGVSGSGGKKGRRQWVPVDFSQPQGGSRALNESGWGTKKTSISVPAKSFQAIMEEELQV